MQPAPLRAGRVVTMLLATLATVAAVALIVINEAAWRDATNVVTNLGQRGAARVQIQTLLRRLIDAETAQRGYLLTGRAEYLKPYGESVQDVDAALAWLRDYYTGDAKATAQLKEMAARTREKQSEMATSLQLFEAGRTEAWRSLLLTDIGREKMEAIRVLSQALNDAETQRVADDRAALFRTLGTNRFGVNALAALSLLALALFLRQAAVHAAAQRAAAQALQAERDHLEAEVASRTADLTALARHLQTAREDERGRLARELHDELGALLTAAKLDAARLKRALPQLTPEAEQRLGHLNASLDQGIGLKRRIIEDLRPSSLNNLGLVAALEILAREFAQRAELAVQTELQELALDEGARITVYRLVQESFTNIAKYAGARQVSVRLVRDGERAQVSVQDDGRGFDAARVRGSARGLMGMRYRVEAEGGVMELVSAPGAGTTLRAWLPLRAAEAEPAQGPASEDS